MLKLPFVKEGNESPMKSQLAFVLFAFAVGCGGSDKPASVEKAPVASSDVDAKQVDVDEPAAIKTTVPVVELAKLPERYADALALGKALVTKGEHPRAREVLMHATKLEKKQAEPHMELARSYIATSERANAIKSANKAVKLAPESSQAYNTLGRAELLRHNYENAIVAFRQATELNEGNVWAWNNLGFTYLTLERYDEAITALVEATGRKGAESYMFNNLGTAYEHLDQLDEARDAYEKGGELGSIVAAASRKRLEGVDTIVIAAADAAKALDDQIGPEPAGKPEKVEPVEKVEKIEKVETFEHSEPMPEPVAEEPVAEEPVAEEPVVEKPAAAVSPTPPIVEDVDDEPAPQPL